MRVLALDHGSARCGVAVSDPTGTLATPLEPVLAPDTRKGLQRVRRVIEETGAERVIVGLPVALHGGDSDQTRAARAFAERLRAATAVPVELSDERFTTSLARQAGGAASLDSRAAAVLLDEWLTTAGHLPIEGGNA
jgi:putative Holliday junction resolvase